MPRTVLIIDDEDDIREVAQLSLEAVGGWNVLVACSGAEGLITARQAKPDAILLDVMMPEMDGPTTFKALRAEEETRNIPVILLTAKIKPSDQERFIQLGVDGIIAKPFDAMTLPKNVATTLGWEGT